MPQKLIHETMWPHLVDYELTTNCRWMARAPGGLIGYGRTKEEALSNCASHADPEYRAAWCD